MLPFKLRSYTAPADPYASIAYDEFSVKLSLQTNEVDGNYLLMTHMLP